MAGIYCGTGHRPDKLGGYSDAVNEKLTSLGELFIERYQPDLVISGMAVGWDQGLAQACINLRIPFKAYCPFPGQEDIWPWKSKVRYQYMLEHAKEIKYIWTQKPTEKYKVGKAMQDRNIAMVDDSDIVAALWNGTTGGTKNCIEYAQISNKEIINLWEIYQILK